MNNVCIFIDSGLFNKGEGADFFFCFIIIKSETSFWLKKHISIFIFLKCLKIVYPLLVSVKSHFIPLLSVYLTRIYHFRYKE